MIFSRTRLKVADNSGAKDIAMICVLGHKKGGAARLGDILSASVKVADPHGNIKKKAVVRALVVRQKKSWNRPDGTVIRFDDNAVVIVDKEGNLRGTRVFGPIAKEIKEKGWEKIASLAKEMW
ncbi:MAG: large subunit ribosomal protein L14 [Candidatus Berkelbacteria bacterium Licking1014_2]|uniref:Large ribosomal subunit protein uL14 n=1 Tax=Candidatus Berkelbacteria bacterium Licking1014_2 TaxID=2017146 RepID=A0A554LWW9_9BACT|nr:MAG: large subunit ribosomal protein L14 [Candidatus Berkelbacteria bacterium Licking1014_2]